MRRTYGALGVTVLGAALALLATGRSWATVRVARTAPLADLVVALSGRAEHAALPVLAVAALAGVVAVLAARGPLRRLVAALLGLCGVGIALFGFAGHHLGVGRARGRARCR